MKKKSLIALAVALLAVAVIVGISYVKHTREFKILTLRNGTTEAYQDVSFVEGDDLYLLFKAPIDGYVTVYLTDAENAFCLLPYQYQTESAIQVEKNKEYVFFSAANAPKAIQYLVDEYHLTCGAEVEHNQVYVIFSSQAFTKAVDEAGAEMLPRYLSLSDFNTWLESARAQDATMQCKIIDIEIQPKE